MQWMSTEGERKIEHASCVESGAIWPKTIGREKKGKEK